MEKRLGASQNQYTEISFEDRAHHKLLADYIS